MAKEAEQSIIGIIENDRRRMRETRTMSFVEEENRNEALRQKLHQLVRTNVKPPNIVETSLQFGEDPLKHNVHMTAHVPLAVVGEFKVNITASEYPLKLSMEEAKIDDDELRGEHVFKRLDAINYTIDVLPLDHAVIIHRDTSRTVRTPDLDGNSLGRNGVNLEGERVVNGTVKFGWKEYELYDGLVETLLTDPNMEIYGTAYSIKRFIQPGSDTRVVGSAEMSSVS